MENDKKDNTKKGLFFGFLATIFIALEPIVSNLRLTAEIYIDPFIFAAMSSLIDAAMFLLLFLFERKKLKAIQETNLERSLIIEAQLNGWKKTNNKILIVVISITFSIVPALMFVGYEMAGSINSSLASKTEIIFSLLFGYLLLKEKVSIGQILFSILLFFGLIFAVTEGSFNLLDFNLGVLILIVNAGIYTFVHAITKSVLEKNELTPFQLIFIRNFFGGTILISAYFLFFPLENVQLLLNPVNYVFFLLMALVYGTELYVWYNTLKNIEIGKATVIISLSPIVTALFGFFVFGENFTIYHLLGMIIIIFSIIMIVREKE